MKLTEATSDLLDKFKFNKDGLIPVIVQDSNSGKVLMLAYMNRESLKLTLENGQTWFYSRSRQELWHKGGTSGHYQHLEEIYYDCDADTILLKIHQDGVACHEGYFSCFHYRLTPDADVEIIPD